MGLFFFFLKMELFFKRMIYSVIKSIGQLDLAKLQKKPHQVRLL